MGQFVKEVAHLRGNDELYKKNYDSIFGKKKEGEMEEPIIECASSEIRRLRYDLAAANDDRTRWEEEATERHYKIKELEAKLSVKKKIEKDQDRQIKELKDDQQRLYIATECLEYYGNKDNCIFEIDGREQGEKAREALAKIKAL